LHVGARGNRSSPLNRYAMVRSTRRPNAWPQFRLKVLAAVALTGGDGLGRHCDLHPAKWVNRWRARSAMTGSAQPVVCIAASSPIPFAPTRIFSSAVALLSRFRWACRPRSGADFGIILVTPSLLGTRLVPGYVASVLLFDALILLGLAAPQDAFSSFSTSAIWLIGTGSVIGAAITHSGLGRRLGVLSQRHLATSYAILIPRLMQIAI
jgi:di/tricarboxylate transporter